MRADQLITLSFEGRDKYNPATGKREGEVIQEKEVYACISETSPEYKDLIFGRVDVEAITLRINSKLPTYYNFLYFDNQKYTITKMKPYRHKTTIYARTY